MTSARLEAFVNDYLRVDLANYEKHINLLNADIMEYVQLKNMIESIGTHFDDGNGFKTQVNIGGNCFIQVRKFMQSKRHVCDSKLPFRPKSKTPNTFWSTSDCITTSNSRCPRRCNSVR